MYDGRQPHLCQSGAFKGSPAGIYGVSIAKGACEGRLAAAEPKIEVNGYTSDQAKTTEDYTEQFAIANCEELLPFLAMNPLLYDDLYNWLEDQGKSDIDAALENNEGYKSYRKAVGK